MIIDHRLSLTSAEEPFRQSLETCFELMLHQFHCLQCVRLLFLRAARVGGRLEQLQLRVGHHSEQLWRDGAPSVSCV